MKELEALRQQLKSLIATVAIVSVIVILVLLIFTGSLPLVIITIILSVFICIFPILGYHNMYKSVYKEQFVSKILQDIFDEVTYIPTHGIPREILRDTNMVYTGDRYSSEDYISATYKGIKFEQADVHIEDEQEYRADEDKAYYKSYETVFMGKWIIFDFNKNFKADIMVAEKGFRITMVNRFYGDKNFRFKKINMESAEFNKTFNVYAQNEHEAFYIITPKLMERLSYLKILNKGKIAFCFHKNRLYIGIDNGENSFEPTGILRHVDEVAIKRQIKDDIEFITQFADQLQLDNDLYKQEG